MIYLRIYLRVAFHWHSSDWPSASEVMLNNMGETACDNNMAQEILSHVHNS